MCLLWVMTFWDLTASVVILRTLSRAFTAGYICLTKDASLSHEGVSIPSFYYSTHNFNRVTLGRCPFDRAHHETPNTMLIYAMHSHSFHAMSSCICNAKCHFKPFHVTSTMRATCKIHNSWIIISTTYNLHPSYKPC